MMLQGQRGGTSFTNHGYHRNLPESEFTTLFLVLLSLLDVQRCISARR